ncbi:ABC transporter ATP-binding protein [Saxibacter everestensis]|uniref:ABC transporter ATP-binding protein n=1 Tax=Saxibacter everestensis TaxID=2909229 RepID=A0ABY8QT34_9MICO|nr:ABC transporter ATP-binding protein [Brevibacteriaceae bacterium ZFBP1038]
MRTHESRFPRLRILWTFVRPHWRVLAVGLALGLASTAMALASPMVTKWVLDSLGASTSLVQPISVLLGLLILGSAVGYFQWVLLGTLAENIVLDARTSMIRKFLNAKVGEVTKRPSGELVTRVTSDTVLLREATSSSVVELVNGVIALFGTLLMMAFLDLALLGTTITAIAVVAVLIGMLMPGIAKAQEKAQESIGNLGGALEGALRAIRTVKASMAEERQADSIIMNARLSANHSIRSVKREAIAWTFSGAGIQLAIIVILGFGAWRVSQGVLEVSSLIAFLLYAFNLMWPIMGLTQNVSTLQSGIAAAGRIREIEVIEPEIGGSTSPPAEAPAGNPQRDPDQTAAILALSNVTAGYGPESEPAIRGIDLAIPRRGHTAIVGPSGAGKTTLFSLILRFLEPQEGELLLDGQPYSALSNHGIRARLAYVEQETPMVPGTIRDNLLFTHPDASESEVRTALREVRLEEKIDSLPDGVETSLSSSAVSGGQRQRIALARAIMRTPDVLLLDEATAQVDGLTEAAIHDCIRDRASTGAVVTIAHRLSTVIDADTIVVMENGRIRDRGTHDELLTRDELYRDLVKALRIESVAAGSDLRF